MKVGIYFPTVKEQGGVYQYALSFLEAFAKIPGHHYLIFNSSKDLPPKYFSLPNFEAVNLNSLSQSSFSKHKTQLFNLAETLLENSILASTIGTNAIKALLPVIYRISYQSPLNHILKNKPDLMFYPISSPLSFISPIPSVVTVHDLQHRLNPQFKEVSAGGRWAMRDYNFSQIAKHAWRILAESNQGKEDLLNFYSLAEDKVIVLPLVPADYLIQPSQSLLFQVKRKFSLPDKFIFYPAKFWPHKNHFNLVKAIGLLKKKKRTVNLVFSGSANAEFSTFTQVMDLAKSLGVKTQVKHVGFVSHPELSCLYKLSQALVMPTYFGATNIPPLEAWVMGTPVLYSNIRGCREQLGNAGLLIEPDSPINIAENISQVYDNNYLREKLIKLGKIRAQKWTQVDFTNKIKKVIRSFKSR